MNLRACLSAALLLCSTSVFGQVSLTSAGTAYTQNFDALSSVAGSTTNALGTAIPGWLMEESGGSARDNDLYGVDTGSSNTGDTYSYGAAGATDRALGALRSGTLVPVFGACFTNNTGSTLTSLAVAYTGEQWRLGFAGRTDQINFEYSLNATSLSTGTWVGVAALNFVSPDTATVGLKNGNGAANRTTVSSSISSLSIANGAGFCIRWTDTDASNADDGLAVDDFSLTPQGAGGGGTPSVSLGVSETAFIESGGTTTVTATLSAVHSSAVTANLLFGGTATLDTDYSVTANSIVIPIGMTSGSITLSAIEDLFFEGDESVITSLGTLTNATAGTPSSATATITENDPMPPPMVGARIYQIQGAMHRSTMANMAVTNVPGIVTARASNGFYMQDADGDSNLATSDGIFVFTSSTPPAAAAVGAQVLVSGTVSEFRPGGEAENLTVTQIGGAPTVTASSGLFTNTTISPTVIGAGTGERTPPTEIIDNDSAGNVETSLSPVFDPAQDGIDFYESLEGMLVAVNSGRVTGPRNGFGEIWVVGAGATGSNARGGITLVERAAGVDFNPERIQLDDGLGFSTPTVDVGDVLSNIRGVASYGFGNFEVLLTQAPTLTDNNLTPSVRTITYGTDRLSIGAYNVENLDPSDTSFARLAGQIVTSMGSPDILALSEVQDNNGATNDGVVAANTTLSLLTAAIVTAGGPSYTCTQIDPVDDQDGGEPGGNIRVVQCYNATRVSFVTGTTGAGGATDATTAELSGGKLRLTLSPGRIAPTNTAAWGASRKPLAATYDFNGRRVVVVNVHFNSKGGDEPLFGVNQPPAFSTEVKRRQQATLVHSFVSSAQALDPNARIVVLGDLNDFDFSPPLRILRKGPLGAGDVDGTLDTLRNLGTELIADEAERYSYIFEGNSQELDHILVTPVLRNASAQYQALHINSEFADQASDHDALIASFLLPANLAPTANAGVDQTVDGGASVTLNGSASSDSDGSVASYAWVQTAGPAVTLGGATTASASFTAPASGTLTFELTVTDNLGATGTDTVTVTVATDITPAPFSFPAVSNVALNSLQTSDAITVMGINGSAPISVPVGTGFFGIGGGPCTQTSGTVTNGQSVVVCHTAPGSFSTPTQTTLTIGANGVLTGVSATFTSTTLAAPPVNDTTPDTFSFNDLRLRLPIPGFYVSNEVRITGINAAAAIGVSGGGDARYSVNGGAFTRTPGTVNNNDRVRLRVFYPTVDFRPPLLTSAATLTVGGVSDIWTVSFSLR